MIPTTLEQALLLPDPVYCLISNILGFSKYPLLISNRILLWLENVLCTIPAPSQAHEQASKDARALFYQIPGLVCMCPRVCVSACLSVSFFVLGPENCSHFHLN